MLTETQTIEQLADAIVGDTDFYNPRSLLSLEQQKAKIRQEVLAALEIPSLTTRLQRGLDTLKRHTLELFTSEEQAELGSALEKMGRGQANWEETTQTLQDALAISDASMHLFYRAANDAYHRQHFEEAGDLFTLLTVLNPYGEHYWIGLGGTAQMLAHYEDALFAYRAAMEINNAYALTHLLACECSLALGQLDQAVTQWERAEKLMQSPAQGNPLWEKLAKNLKANLAASGG